MKRVLAAAFLCLTLSIPAWAGFVEGYEAYKRGDYATALREFRPLAEQGDVVVQNLLGFMYDNGKGVPKDYAAAMKWYRKAAEQGDVIAQSRLGVMYSIGHGARQDYTKAAKWYRKAAEQGDAKAQNGLARMYSAGSGVGVDYVLAYKWWSLAAASGNTGDKKYFKIVEKGMTPFQIAEAQKLAREWWAKHRKDK
jgi:hypothetical protein